MNNKKTGSMRLAVASAAAAAITMAVAAPAGAATATAVQTVDATMASTISMTTPASVTGWTLASTGANTTAAGTFTVTSNDSYTVAVIGQKNTLTQWNTTLVTPDYVTGGRALASPTTVTPTRTGGTAAVPGVATAGVVTSTAGAAIVTGTGLGTDIFTLELSQPTTIADAPLPTGHTYHNRLTYTATTALKGTSTKG